MPVRAMQWLLDLPSMESSQKVEQVKAYLTAMQNPNNLLHNTVNGLGLITMTHSNMLKLDRVHNEVISHSGNNRR